MTDVATSTGVPLETSTPSEASVPSSLDNSWIVIMASLAESNAGSGERAAEEAARLNEQGVGAAVLRTSQYPALRPGYWIVYLADGFGDEAAASAACDALVADGKVAECFPRFLGQVAGS
jgi:hypothetical protein